MIKQELIRAIVLGLAFVAIPISFIAYKIFQSISDLKYLARRKNEAIYKIGKALFEVRIIVYDELKYKVFCNYAKTEKEIEKFIQQINETVYAEKYNKKIE